ncbi:DUF2968 domain-containing protein [Paenalcaligenes niemegkensis]|uniref:DUF2968 domain-containing protein n=1 Tax=Paenalcaligenes niemegkensis TaxID=2895469 RepID=UPI001EE94398|nr:DUF2968 domain-containing protein [Paenalcaligenes niemegkensis]MCQ9616983.1 DUF2968 domain-containing protein [Paenalcaligenes niemegkensis]
MGSTTIRKQVMTIKLCSLVVLALGISACSSISLKEDEPARPVVQQTQDTAEESTELRPIAEPEPAPALQKTPGGTADELQALIQDRSVRELRTAYNGSYGVSMLFNPETLDYYVALFQQQRFWRIFRTQLLSEAESTYTAYRQETVALASTELQRIRLEAEYNKIESELSDSADTLTTLQNDMEYQRQQEALIIAEQQSAKREAEQLAEQEREARKQLQVLQEQIRQLERQRSTIRRLHGQ